MAKRGFLDAWFAPKRQRPDTGPPVSSPTDASIVPLSNAFNLAGFYGDEPVHVDGLDWSAIQAIHKADEPKERGSDISPSLFDQRATRARVICANKRLTSMSTNVNSTRSSTS